MDMEKVKVLYTNCYNEKNEPVVVVCTMYSEELDYGARGVAVCSWADPVSLKIGKIQAYRKALRGLKRRGNEEITDDRAIRRILTTSCPFTFHVDMFPRFTFQERRALFGKSLKPVFGGIK